MYLRVEEDLWPQEALIANIDCELLFGDGVDACVLFDPLGTVCVVLIKLLYKIGTHVAKALLNQKNNSKLVKTDKWQGQLLYWTNQSQKDREN